MILHAILRGLFATFLILLAVVQMKSMGVLIILLLIILIAVPVGSDQMMKMIKSRIRSKIKGGQSPTHDHTAPADPSNTLRYCSARHPTAQVHSAIANCPSVRRGY